MALDHETIHTLSVCASVLGGFGSVIGVIWKMVTNHVWHMKEDIIQNADSNRRDVVEAIQTSTIQIVSALKK